MILASRYFWPMAALLVAAGFDSPAVALVLGALLSLTWGNPQASFTGQLSKYMLQVAVVMLGFGLPSSAPSLGELTLQAKQNLQAPWLAFTAFFTFAIMLSLLVFIFEGVRDAFDPRKTFK